MNNDPIEELRVMLQNHPHTPKPTTLVVQCLAAHDALRAELDKIKVELAEAKKWKEEDPRMLREQIRVADVAFNHLHAEHAKLTTALDAERKITKSLRDQLADPPPDVQELVIKKCNLVSAEALDTERAKLEKVTLELMNSKIELGKVLLNSVHKADHNQLIAEFNTERARVEVMRELLERPTPNMHTTETCKWFSDRDALLKSLDAPNVLLKRLREAEGKVSRYEFVLDRIATRLEADAAIRERDGILRTRDIAIEALTNDNRRGEK